MRDQLRQAIIRKGWSATARLSGVDRTVLHRAFRPEGDKARMPSFTTVTLVAEALGLRLTVTDPWK